MSGEAPHPDALPLLDRLVDAVGGPKAAAELCGVSRNTMLLWRKGVSRVPLQAALLLAQHAGLSIDELLLSAPGNSRHGAANYLGAAPDDEEQPFSVMVTENPPPGGVAAIALVDARAAAGDGAWNGPSAELGRIPFPLEWLRKLGASGPERCDFIRAAGDSMEPTIAPGALLLIDRDQAEPPKARRGKRKAGPVPDDIYVFIFESDLRVKRLASVEPGRLAIISDNSAVYPIEILSKDESARVKILGRVIWWDNRL